ncbi:F-box protein At3g12350-like isoform X2 [Olea europaea var. sylvestris]|uniref:Uncharacterized protein n=1 Tax=Olea europaea subsp. europaea TaxID=158383 RepID=A0A8S0PKM9_OLEEU|nr:F-box protein At3g12350-like isoform X2 [Olea europaea var. sylvestris]CAA2953592.1 Hypothetical predicted protein [Olea europaea subsp. europaea]
MDSEKLGCSENELIQVNMIFKGKCYVVVEENLGSLRLGKVPSSGHVRAKEYQNECRSPRDQLRSEINQFLAKRRSHDEKAVSRRQRREKESQERLRKREPEHLVKILNCSPTLARPLQGLWKPT